MITIKEFRDAFDREDDLSYAKFRVHQWSTELNDYVLIDAFGLDDKVFYENLNISHFRVNNYKKTELDYYVSFDLYLERDGNEI